MRYVTAILFCLLISTPAWAEDKTSSDLILAESKDLIMGDTLTITVSGEYADKIKADKTKSLTLYLDDVAMTGLPVLLVEDIAKKLKLNFKLIRNSEDELNRTAWDTFLKKHTSTSKVVNIAVAIANDSAWRVSNKPFSISAADSTIIRGVTVAVLAVFLIAYYFLVKHPSALRDAKNGTYSLGKSQMAFWGMAVALSFAGIWLVTHTMERIPPKALVLLGISGATGLSAIVIGGNKDASFRAKIDNDIDKLKKEQSDLSQEKAKDPTLYAKDKEIRLAEIATQIAFKENEVNQVSAPSASQGFWQDICDDGNGLSFHRLQVVIWTLILGTVFIYSVKQVISMPDFSETLLILMGISNGTYLGFKIPEK